jgi:hypothetical protein
MPTENGRPKVPIPRWVTVSRGMILFGKLRQTIGLLTPPAETEEKPQHFGRNKFPGSRSRSRSENPGNAIANMVPRESE